LLRSPARPGFFEVRQGGALLLRCAAHFADVREADFRSASSSGAAHATDAAVLLRNSRPDPFVSLWTFALAGLLVADWTLQGRRAAGLRGEGSSTSQPGESSSPSRHGEGSPP